MRLPPVSYPVPTRPLLARLQEVSPPGEDASIALTHPQAVIVEVLGNGTASRLIVRR